MVKKARKTERIVLVGTRKELLSKLYEMLASESGQKSHQIYFIRASKWPKESRKDEKLCIGVIKKLSDSKK